MAAEQLLLRLIIAAGLSLLGLGLYWGWQRFLLRRLGRAPGERLVGLESLQPGVPGILYFTTPDCQVCLTTQKPALRRLETEMGPDVQIIEVDATARPDLADYWGVLSVPTTFIIDGQGQPRGFNPGLTSEEKLRRQIEATRVGGADLAAETPATAQRVEFGSNKI
jgi:thioredoxin-like negative regulator of GroEL